MESPNQIFAILMASGFSERFGRENKLLAPFRGKPLARHTLDLACGLGLFSGIFFVAADEQVAALAGEAGQQVTVIRNRSPERGQRESIRLGVEAAPAGKGGEAFYMFFPCDQPLLDGETVRRIVAARQPGCIVEPRHGGVPGSPSLFSACFSEELRSLGEGDPPRLIKARHPGSVIGVEITNPVALVDIDEKGDMELE